MSSIAEASGSAAVTATLSTASGLPVTVNLTVSGTASLGSDFTLSTTSFTIPAGVLSSNVTVKAIQDSLDEANETVVLSIGSVVNGVVGSNSMVTVSITDDDAPPSVALSVAGPSTLVESRGCGTVTATLSAVSGLPVTAYFSFSGSATLTNDYEISSLAIAIPAGSTSASMTLRAVDDTLVEGLETVVVDIQSVTNGTESGVQRVTFGIIDDDQHWVGIGNRVSVWTNGVPASRVRLGVRDEGVYRVRAEEIACAAGVATNDVLSALASGGLSLTCQGQAISWTADNASLYFFGLPAHELFAPENVYWLAFGSGVQMQEADATPVEGLYTNRWFMHEEHYRSSFLTANNYRDRRSTTATLTNVLNFGEWIPASANEDTRAQSRTLFLPGFCATAATGVTVRVDLASYYEFVAVDSHACEILVNGVSCGTRSWDGEQALTLDYPVPAGVVTNETVLFKVRNAGGATTECDFMVLDAALVYPRRYAADGQLRCTGGAEGTASVEVCSSGNHCVLDVTDASVPVVLNAATETTETGSNRVVFACGDASHVYAVADLAAGCYEPSVSGVRDIDWSDPAEMPELAIVIPPQRWVSGFAEAVQPLANFRNRQGLRARIIDAEEIYDAFTDGLVHPLAFRRFSAAGVTNGAPVLRYLLFAGYGGTDYKLDVYRLGETGPFPCLFPLYLLPTIDPSAPGALLLPNDVVLGDVAGGAVPEVAVGRFIATNAVELSYMVDKTIRYELTSARKKSAIFSADWQNVGDKYANFTGIASNTASAFAMAGWQVLPFYPGPTQSYLGNLWKDTYYGTGAYYELQKGAGFFYFVGHSSDTVAGNSSQNKLFDATVLRSGSWSFAPVALLMGCRMGRWTLLDVVDQLQAISEAGVRNRNSGFTAAIAASGYMTTAEAVLFSEAFGQQVASGTSRLGDAWRGALASMGDDAVLPLQHLALLGDPSLWIRVDKTARDTSATWLIEQGLTNNAYADLLDQDGDGFPTWMEVQAGTDYMRAGALSFSSLGGPPRGAPASTNAALTLTFEVLQGLSYRLESADDLAVGNWQRVPWRAVGDEAWSWSAIAGDWPVKTVQVPYVPAVSNRFYRVISE